ncbi:EF-hand domain-containing protein [Variovorax paradoxus]|uniref:EF-hand domain-containing protein n=1 Tax=Variovorax paradoxus TaxID=34073 RepID=UPI0021ACBA95|nr:EF-hand domain-containing protein [Variovorax paradoxus]UVH60305.1 EF-hand domain-containing protein [Variovorax paradoxus]
MTTRHVLPLLLAAVSFAACAQAPDAGRAEQMRTELHKRFGAADTNVDGRLTRDEARGKMPWVYRNFDAIDSAHAGSVTMAQIEAYAVTQQRSSRQK